MCTRKGSEGYSKGTTQLCFSGHRKSPPLLLANVSSYFLVSLPTLAGPVPCLRFFKLPQSQQPFHRCIPSPSLPCEGHICHLEVPA